MTDTYIWTDNPTEVGVADCNPDILNEDLMHLKYDKKVDRNITNLGTCNTAAATAAKTVTIPNFELVEGATVRIKFPNGNTASTLSLNVNASSDISVADELGNIIGSGVTSYALIPTNATVEFYYNGTNWVMINSLVYADSGIEKWANGFMRQWGYVSAASVTSKVINYPVSFKVGVMRYSLNPCIPSDTGGIAVNLGVGSPDINSLTQMTISCASLAGLYIFWEVAGY